MKWRGVKMDDEVQQAIVIAFKQLKEEPIRDPNVLAQVDGFSELGRFNVTKQARDIGAFKTPTLRDVELTAPYMPNGSFKTLIDVSQILQQSRQSERSPRPGD